LGLLPTVIVLGYGVAWRLPQHVQAEAERLGDRIGMKVSMKAIRHLRPGMVRYEGLELLNPETGRPVLRCGTLQAGWDQIADAEGRQQPALVFSATDPEIDMAQVEQLWRLADRLFLGRADGPLEVRLACGDLLLRLGENRQALSRPELAVTTDSLGTRADLRFRLPGGDSSSPVRLRVARDRRRQPPLTRFDLDTGGAAMPCWLLATGLPSFDGLGAESRYSGTLWATLPPTGSAGNRPFPAQAQRPGRGRHSSGRVPPGAPGAARRLDQRRAGRGQPLPDRRLGPVSPACRCDRSRDGGPRAALSNSGRIVPVGSPRT
jgi:hypothetical protein